MGRRKEFEKLIGRASRTQPADLVLRFNREVAPIIDLSFTESQIENVRGQMCGGGLFIVSAPMQLGKSTMPSLFALDYIRATS